MRAAEFDLLLSLARTVPDAERANAIVDAGVDWRACLDLATRHRVRPLVYKSLSNVCWDRVPAEVQSDWEQAYHSISGRNRFATGELIWIADAFREAELPLVTLKGPVLAEMAYCDFALREFSDLDLLIRVADFKKAYDLLKRLGYTPVLNVGGDQVLQFLWHQGELTFTSNLQRPEIDLHWRAATTHTALSIEADYFWSRFQPVQLAGETVLSFAPQDLPLYLASQGGQDQWSDLRRLCDLTEFLRRRPDFDWEQLMEAGRRLHGSRVLLLGLQLASDLLGAEIPHHVRQGMLQDAALPRLAARAVKKLEGPDLPGIVSLFVFQFEAKERWQEKVALVIGRLTDRTAGDGKWIILPKPLWGLYWLLRPLRMLGKLLRKSDSS
jgi:hypothetical protein